MQYEREEPVETEEEKEKEDKNNSQLHSINWRIEFPIGWKRNNNVGK